MKNFDTPIWVRAAVATALCLSFVIYPQLRLSSVQAAVGPAAEVKSESQLRTEASRYDAAIRAIGGISTMKLETGEDLKKAIAILDRERPNLKFHFSKLVVLSISDATFSSAVKKKTPDKRAAEAFAKELRADPKAVLKLEGTAALKTRIQQSAEAAAAVLRRAGERLREAAERIRKAGQRSAAPGAVAAGGLMLVRAGFSVASEPVASDALVVPPQVGVGETILIIAVAVIIYSTFGVALLNYFFDIGEKEDKDQVAECQGKADDRYRSCVSEATDLPAGFPLFLREAATALCYSDWLVNQAGCLTLII